LSRACSPVGVLTNFTYPEICRDVDVGVPYSQTRLVSIRSAPFQCHLRHHTLGIEGPPPRSRQTRFQRHRRISFSTAKRPDCARRVQPASPTGAKQKTKPTLVLSCSIGPPAKPSAQSSAGHKCGEFHNVVPEVTRLFCRALERMPPSLRRGKSGPAHAGAAAFIRRKITRQGW